MVEWHHAHLKPTIYQLVCWVLLQAKHDVYHTSHALIYWSPYKPHKHFKQILNKSSACICLAVTLFCKVFEKGLVDRTYRTDTPSQIGRNPVLQLLFFLDTFFRISESIPYLTILLSTIYSTLNIDNMYLYTCLLQPTTH